MLRARLAERLQDLLLDNDALEDFLRQLAALAAEFAAAETGRPVLCSVRLARRRQLKVVAGSSPEALILDSLQDCMSEGPGLEAGQAGLAVLVPDTTMDPRWRRYQRAAAQRGNRSILAVTLLADRDATAVLTFSSTSPEAFDDDAVAACAALAVRAAKVVRLAVRLDSAQGLNRDLLQAMRSRTASAPQAATAPSSKASGDVDEKVKTAVASRSASRVTARTLRFPRWAAARW